MRILVAVDGSESSQAAVHAVLSRPWPEGSVIRVVSVAERVYAPPPAPAQLGIGATPSQPVLSIPALLEQQRAQAQVSAERAANTLQSTNLSVEADALSGDPRTAIVDHARDWKADLIVLGSHGRTGLKRWILGSVAESVVRHAPCSVEVARVRTP